MDGDSLGRLLYLGLLILAVLGWALIEFRQRMGLALRMGLVWGLIFLGVVAGYGLWHDIRRDTVLMTVGEGGEIQLNRMVDGHYYVTLVINGTDVRFMVDTGASGMVLTLDDAHRVGFDPNSLSFQGRANTANGPVRIATVTLPVVELGSFRDRDFRAFVNQGSLPISLLGMDYLGKFRIEVAGDRMILTR